MSDVNIQPIEEEPQYKPTPRPVSPPAGGDKLEDGINLDDYLGNTKEENPEKVPMPEKPEKPPQKNPKDIKAAMERQAGVGEGYPELPQGTKIIPKKISSEGTILEDPEALEAQTVEASQAEDPLSVPAPVKTAAAKYEAYVDPNTPEAQAVKGKLSSEAIIGDIQGAVSDRAIAEAATGEVDERSTVKYQLGELFKSFEEGKDPPAWASPAVRAVTAQMQARSDTAP